MCLAATEKFEKPSMYFLTEVKQILKIFSNGINLHFSLIRTKNVVLLIYYIVSGPYSVLRQHKHRLKEFNL